MYPILYFGNEHLDYDNSAIKLVNRIKGNFIHCKDPSRISEYIKDGELILIDTVHGIEKVTLIDRFQLQQKSSAHDLDLSYYLKLYEQMGILKKATIIGIPIHGNHETMKKMLMHLLSTISNQP